MPGLAEQLPLIFGELDDADERNIVKLLRVWLSGAAGLEFALQQLFSERSIDTAIGEQLNTLGQLVGQKRNGLDDDTYRRYIRARVSANRSRGNAPDVIAVADLVVYDDDAYLHVKRQYNASYHFVVEDIIVYEATLNDALIEFLRASSAAGVRVMLETWPEAEAELFELGWAGGSATTTDKGLGWTGDGTLGGGLTRAVD